MKSFLWTGSIVLVSLLLIFMITKGIEQSSKSSAEILKIRVTAETAVKNYYHNSLSAPVCFPDFPVCYKGGNQWITNCYVDMADEFGINHRTGFDVLVWKENRLWKASIAKVENDQPVPKPIEKPLPWEYLFGTSKKPVN